MHDSVISLTNRVTRCDIHRATMTEYVLLKRYSDGSEFDDDNCVNGATHWGN